MASPETINYLVREGLLWENKIKKIELFDPRCIVKRCHRCQGYSHIRKHCKNNEKCEWCAIIGHDMKICQLDK